MVARNRCDGAEGPGVGRRAELLRALGATLLVLAGLRNPGVETLKRYKTTTFTVLACIRKLLAGAARAGWQTPASAFGVDLIRQLPGFVLEIGRSPEDMR